MILVLLDQLEVMVLSADRYGKLTVSWKRVYKHVFIHCIQGSQGVIVSHHLCMLYVKHIMTHYVSHFTFPIYSSYAGVLHRVVKGQRLVSLTHY